MTAFANIKTSDELKTRVKNGKLSVGCYFNNIRHLLSEKESKGKNKVEVKYSARYGTTTKVFYI